MTNKEFQDILKAFPDDAELHFISYCENWGGEVNVRWEQDPNTDYTTDLPDTKVLWITVG